MQQMDSGSLGSAGSGEGLVQSYKDFEEADKEWKSPEGPHSLDVPQLWLIYTASTNYNHPALQFFALKEEGDM